MESWPTLCWKLPARRTRNSDTRRVSDKQQIYVENIAVAERKGFHA